MRFVALQGERVRLEPLRPDHVDALCRVGLDVQIWRWNSRPVSSREDMDRYVREALEGCARGDMFPYVTIVRSSGELVGSTRYGNIDPVNRRLEIGWTWLTPSWQRRGVNRESKLLMMEYAFDTLNCVRVEFKTDVRNEQSRKALLGVGAVEEGVLRKHMIVDGGGFRDTIYYSILDEEWPGVRARLQRSGGGVNGG